MKLISIFIHYAFPRISLGGTEMFDHLIGQHFSKWKIMHKTARWIISNSFQILFWCRQDIFCVRKRHDFVSCFRELKAEKKNLITIGCSWFWTNELLKQTTQMRTLNRFEYCIKLSDETVAAHRCKNKLKTFYGYKLVCDINFSVAFGATKCDRGDIWIAGH